MADPDPTKFVKAVGGGMSDDGHTFMLQFGLANGSATAITFPAAAASSLMLDTEKALGSLQRRQRAMLKGEDPRIFFPIGAKRAKTFQGAISHDGRPVLSLLLETDLRLDISVDPAQIPALIEFLRDLLTTQRKASRKAH
jgi:hypothetical protein